MKLLVISDIHGRYEKLERILALHGNSDAILFLGDGLRDIQRLTDIPQTLISVRGNCDVFSFGSEMIPAERLLCFDRFKILMMHGHEHSVKAGVGRAVRYAVAKDADILLYGHTHEREEKYFNIDDGIFDQKPSKPLYMFNPGSLGMSSSFGLIQIQNGSALFSHGTV